MSSEEWNLDKSIAYLNHAAVAPWPARTKKAVCQFAEENALLGSQNYPQWMQTEQHLREQLAALINAESSDEIALLKNTSEGLSLVAHGLSWQAGDNVVISDEEFPSNRIVWESLESEGVEVRQVTLGADPEQALINATDSRTRLLSISSVQYATGLRMDLTTLGQHCHKQKILFCIDAIQSIGAVEFDTRKYRADFVVADGHKWMCGPEGLALFYCRREHFDRLKLLQFGWHMLANPGDFDSREWQPAATARRFECGSPNMLTIHALSASLSLLQETGMAEVEKRLHANVEYLLSKLANLPGIEFVTQNDRARRAGIVAFRLAGADHDALQQKLMKAGVMCALRGGAIRFSPHYYTLKSTMDKAVELVHSFIG